ncbi:MAG: putative metal-dependent hydrolase [Burkholderiales bacterium]|jgi:L-ascorbate metabolism protein UlaG (beta-lactamase superfamily)|nr:putative metal-dependent hydrolase [Burkholderiales bacterium]
MNNKQPFHAACLFAFAVACAPTWAQHVKVTPLGSHAGELCAMDRATIFEDPSGVRILYDAGRSVTGAEDPRLGNVHVVLLTHAHGDHIGDGKLASQGAGTCEKPQTVTAVPNSTTAEIAAAKNAVLMMVADMGVFVGKKVENIRGKPTGACASSGGAISVPQAMPCLANAHLGGSHIVKTGESARGVEITIIFASHANNVPRSLLTEPHSTHLAADNVSIALGPPTGYVIKFTNGLVAYLTGDTGIHTEMKSVVHDFHKANLMMINFGSSAVDAQAAAHAANELVRPASVIISHVNEGATAGGKLKPTSRTAAFVKLVKNRPVHLAISGRTLEFDGSGRCVTGC